MYIGVRERMNEEEREKCRDSYEGLNNTASGPCVDKSLMINTG